MHTTKIKMEYGIKSAILKHGFSPTHGYKLSKRRGRIQVLIIPHSQTSIIGILMYHTINFWIEALHFIYFKLQLNLQTSMENKNSLDFHSWIIYCVWIIISTSTFVFLSIHPSIRRLHGPPYILASYLMGHHSKPVGPRISYSQKALNSGQCKQFWK